MNIVIEKSIPSCRKKPKILEALHLYNKLKPQQNKITNLICLEPSSFPMSIRLSYIYNIPGVTQSF